MRSLVGWICVGIVFTALASERSEAGWRLDVQAGAIVPTSNVEFRNNRVDVDTDLDAGLSIVVGGAYGLGDWVEITTQVQTAGTVGLYEEDTFGVFSVTPGARVFALPPGLVRPWLGFQLGYYRVGGEFNDDFIFDNPDDDVDRVDDSFGINVGGGVDFRINHRVSLGLDIRYHNAFDALNGFEFVTTNFNVGIHFGE